jgi:hypothetical protein
MQKEAHAKHTTANQYWMTKITRLEVIRERDWNVLVIPFGGVPLVGSGNSSGINAPKSLLLASDFMPRAPLNSTRGVSTVPLSLLGSDPTLNRSPERPQSVCKQCPT